MKLLIILVVLIPIITVSDSQEALEETVKGNNEFAIKFFKHVTSVSSQGKAKNIVASPISLSSILSMLTLGAQSTTKEEIWKALSLDNNEETEVHQAFSSLLQELNKPRSSLQLNIDNAIFVEKTITLLKRFEDDVQRYYYADVRKTDFNNSEEATKEINEYVKNKTEGKIEEIIDKVSEDAKMVLLNSVLFRGEWVNPFHPNKTKVGKFFLDSNTTVDVQMMNRIGQYNTYHDTQLPCTVVELPYKDNASMIIAVAEPGKIHEVEQGLCNETIQRWKTSFTSSNIKLVVPKLSISSTLNLREVLPELGINEAFTYSANFSGITRDIPLKVGQAVHKAVLKVDEKGTEAAAVTAVEMVPVMIYPSIQVDTPFVLIISEHHQNSILFMATVMDPTEQ
ncbi:serine protease inhibitor A6-like [Pyxicephalus adspersus]|uniref:serine protease inhibitor A6-like n=1 Tax=Pyxicephalus adspersus TaxID=30357 RepID=UPI003B593C45